MKFQQYLDEHSIDDMTASKFGLKEVKDTRYGTQLAIPIKDTEGSVLFYKYRNLETENKPIPKYTFDSGAHETTFNQEIIKDNQTLVIFEGEIDAIRASQAGIPAISGTNGAASIPDSWKETLKGKEIYICYDNDNAGKKAIYQLSKTFPKAKIISLPDGFKDASDYLTKNSKQDFVELIKQAPLIQEWQVKHPKEEYETISLKELLTYDFPEEEWLIDKFLPSSGFVFISGESGTGKSFLALSMAKAVADSTSFLDKFESQQAQTLIIDKENGLRRMQTRMKGLSVSTPEHIHLLKYPEKFSLEDEGFMQAIQNFIEVNKVRLVILDSFIDVIVGNENSSTDVSVVLNALRSISTDVCWLILHHEAKPIPRFTKTAGQRMRGSGNILAQIDYQFATTLLADGKTIHIEQGKNRDNEKMKKFAIEFQSSEAGEMTGFKLLGDISEQNTKLEDTKNLIVSTLQVATGYQIPQKELIDNLTGSISEKTIRDALKVLQLEGTVKKVPIDGAYNKKAIQLMAFLPNDDLEQTTFIENLEDIIDID